jgi:phage terminase small subunit
METRGREAKAEREVANVVSIADARPEPPAPLSPEEADEWRRVVNSMSTSWYRKEYQGVLVAYCRQVVLGNYFHGLAAAITTTLRETDAGMKQFLDLTKAAERADRAADKFGTTLRITPQSRYDKDKAARDSNKVQARPW